MPPALPLAAALIVLLAATMRRSRVVAGWMRRRSRRVRIAAAAGDTALTFGTSSFLLLACAGVPLSSVVTMPDTLRTLATRQGLAATLSAEELRTAGGVLLVALATGNALLFAIASRTGRLPGLAFRSSLRAIDAREMPAAAFASLSAGVSEELFFRLLLPLLTWRATGSDALTIGAPLLLFALVHRHQGWRGIVATGLVGAVFLFAYFSTGMLWAAMLLHTLVDLNALVLRPWIERRVSS